MSLLYKETSSHFPICLSYMLCVRCVCPPNHHLMPLIARFWGLNGSPVAPAQALLRPFRENVKIRLYGTFLARILR